MVKEGGFEFGKSPLRQRRVPPAVAWACRILGGVFIAYAVFSLVMHIAGIGIWKYGSAWSDLYPLCLGGYLLVMSFAWQARDRKRAFVLMGIAVGFMVIGWAVMSAGISRRHYEPQAKLTGWPALKGLTELDLWATPVTEAGEQSITKAISGLRVLR